MEKDEQKKFSSFTDETSTETYQEKTARIKKTYIVDNILSMLDILQKRFGEEKRDILAMQILDFLDSEQKPTDFDSLYLETMEERVRRYLKLMRKLQLNSVRSTTPTLPQQDVPKDTKSKTDEDGESPQLDVRVTMMEKLDEEMTEKQKVLYYLLDDMAKKTYNPEFHDTRTGLRKGPSAMGEYARFLTFPAMEEWLPYSIPDRFVTYLQQFGIGDSAKCLDQARALVLEISQLKQQIQSTIQDILSSPSMKDEEIVHISDGSKVFTGDYFPVPIDKQSTKWAIGTPHDRTKPEEDPLT